MTEVDDAEAQGRKDADKELSKAAWGLVWNRKTPFFATFGLAVVFSVRAFVCNYEAPYPEELNFEWYGEHCGPGHGTGGEAVDELDEACRRHDEAYRKAKKTPELHETPLVGESPMSTP